MEFSSIACGHSSSPFKPNTSICTDCGRSRDSRQMSSYFWVGKSPPPPNLLASLPRLGTCLNAGISPSVQPANPTFIGVNQEMAIPSSPLSPFLSQPMASSPTIGPNPIWQGSQRTSKRTEYFKWPEWMTALFFDVVNEMEENHIEREWLSYICIIELLSAHPTPLWQRMEEKACNSLPVECLNMIRQLSRTQVASKLYVSHILENETLIFDRTIEKDRERGVKRGVAPNNQLHVLLIVIRLHPEKIRRKNSI